MQDLRANTEVIVTIGPFVDKDDGLTPETGVAVSSADEAELIKHGSTSVVDISGATWAAVTNADGYYSLTLTTSHTDTEGQLTIIVQDDSVCLPVRNVFRVLSEAAYDSLYAAKDDGFMDVNIKTIGRADTQETEADNLEAACSNYSATRGLSGTALPAAAADAAGGLPISDAGGLDLDTILDVAISTRSDFDETTDDVTLADGAITDAKLAGALETVFETDFATNYNATRNAWATNVQDFVGTSAADPFNGQVVSASVTGAVGSVTGAVGSVTGNVGGDVQGNVDGTVAGKTPAEAGDEMDLVDAPNATAITAIQSGLSTADKMLGYFQLLARSDAAITSDRSTELSEINADEGSGAGDYAGTTESQEALRDHVGDGTNLTEAGGDGDHLTEAGGDGDHLTEAGGDGDHLSAIPKTGFKLASDGLDSVEISEPSGMFAWSGANFVDLVGVLGVLMRNEINSDSDSVDVRNDADSANLWTYSTSDDGSTFTSGEGG